MSTKNFAEEVKALIETLPEFERELVNRYFGIGYDKSYSYEELAAIYGKTPGEIRKIFDKSIMSIKDHTDSFDDNKDEDEDEPLFGVHIKETIEAFRRLFGKGMGKK